MKKKIDYVRSFYEQYDATGKKRACELYKLYSALVPVHKRVTQSTFVRWSPLPHKKVRRRIAAGEWITESIIDFGDVKMVADDNDS